MAPSVAVEKIGPLAANGCGIMRSQIRREQVAGLQSTSPQSIDRSGNFHVPVFSNIEIGRLGLIT
jgi:hypothetical protein